MTIFQFCRRLLPKNSAHCNIITNSVLRRTNYLESGPEKSYPNKLKYLLILDFEATCDQTKIVQEIIEFPCLKINLETTLEEGRFHRYVKPVINPILTPFCTELTGIIQGMVDEEENFPKILESFEEWREKEGLTSENSLYVTSGDWDLGQMIPRQCDISNLEIPKHMMEWIDIKKLYGNNYKQYSNNLANIMKAFELQFEGRAHSGIDDCLNIYKIVRKLINLEIKFLPTSRLNITNTGRQIHIYGAKKFVPPTSVQGPRGNCDLENTQCFKTFGNPVQVVKIKVEKIEKNKCYYHKYEMPNCSVMISEMPLLVTVCVIILSLIFFNVFSV